MQKESMFEPLFKTIDKVFFGFQEVDEIEKKPDFIQCDNDEEYDVERSMN